MGGWREGGAGGETSASAQSRCAILGAAAFSRPALGSGFGRGNESEEGKDGRLGWVSSVAQARDGGVTPRPESTPHRATDDVNGKRMKKILDSCQIFPGDGTDVRNGRNSDPAQTS